MGPQRVCKGPALSLTLHENQLSPHNEALPLCCPAGFLSQDRTSQVRLLGSVLELAS